MNLPTFEPLADDALLLRFGEVIEQAADIPGAFGLPVETVAEALRACLRVAITATEDQRLAAGAEH